MKSKLASLFSQAAEAQQNIDESARRVIESFARLVDLQSDVVPSTRDVAVGRDFGWHDAVAHQLAREGFGVPEAFESPRMQDRPPETRVVTEFALGDAGSIVASWFAMPPTKARGELPIMNLVTHFEDGQSVATTSGGRPQWLPMLPTEHDEYLPEETTPDVLLAHHRARIAAHAGAARSFGSVREYLDASLARDGQRAAYRRGLGVAAVEHALAVRYTGDDARVGDAYLEAFRRHPEWYKYSGAAPAAPSPLDTMAAISDAIAGTPAAPRAADAPELADDPDADLPLRFLMSPTDDGRRTITTFGMLLSGLPELMMTGVAANHCRAARVVLGTVSAGIARVQGAPAHETGQHMARVVSSTGARLVITADDAAAAGLTPDGSEPSGTPVEVQLSLRGFTPDDEPSMLHVEPLPDEPGTADERLREACARLGAAVPVARDEESADDAMREAHERAVARLGDVRARWLAGDGGRVLVKTRVVRGGAGEYVWVEVRDWRDGTIDGSVFTPAPRLGLAQGESRSIDEAEVYDQLVLGADGPALPALTDLVATDYGMDI